MGETPTQPEHGKEAWTAPPLLSAEEREAVRERRLAEQAASVEATNTFMEIGEPTPVTRDTVELDASTMTASAKVHAMRRAGMSDDEISAHLRTEESAAE